MISKTARLTCKISEDSSTLGFLAGEATALAGEATEVGIFDFIKLVKSCLKYIFFKILLLVLIREMRDISTYEKFLSFCPSINLISQLKIIIIITEIYIVS